MSKIKRIKWAGYPPYQQSVYDSEELTALELAGRTTYKMNEVIDHVNGVQADIDSRERSENITRNRKLSPEGDFTGTIRGRSTVLVLGDIKDSLSLSETIIEMINARESIGGIYDGGLFGDTYSNEIDGGMF